jgi:hypothetical protein
MKFLVLAVASASAIVVSAIAIASAVASTTGLPLSLVGCWGRTVANGQPGIPGLWHVKVKPSGAVAAYTPANSGCGAIPDFTGKIAVSGHRLTIGPLPICAGPGTYSWNAAAASLTLATVQDACWLRVALFAGVWKKAALPAIAQGH